MGVVITGYKAYTLYLAVKNHFTTDRYNMIESRGRVNASKQTFENRNDAKFFHKLGRKFDSTSKLIEYYIANFIYENNHFVWNLSRSDAPYNEWLRRKANITEVFSDDISKILERIDDSDEPLDFLASKVKYSMLMDMFMEKEITIETLRIIEDISPYLDSWETDANIGGLWKNEIRIIKKLHMIIRYDKDKVMKIWNEHFMDILKRSVDNENEEGYDMV